MRRFARKMLCAALTVCFVLSLPVAVWASSSTGEEVAVEPYVAEVAGDKPPEVGAEAYIVMDAQTGQVLVEKNAEKREFPASITKILTLALALEAKEDYKAALDDPIEVSYTAAHSLLPGAASISLTEGEVVSFRDMLYAAETVSANDAANVLAEYTAGSMETFALRMTDKVAELGGTGSNFVNASGLPDPNHYTTAADMARVTAWALTVPGFREIFGCDTYEMQPTNKQPAVRKLNTINKMIDDKSKYHYNGIVGGKTGYTNDARYTLVSTAKRGDTELICVVLKCDRNEMVYQDSWALLEYCFNNFTRVSYPATRIQTAQVPVFGGGSKPLGDITVQGGEDMSFLLHNAMTLDDVQIECQIPESYVIGQSFTPLASFTLAGDCITQQSALGGVQLSWSGLEELLASNTAAPWEQVAQSHPLEFWFVVCIVTGLLLGVIGRAIHVHNRRNYRRKARLAAARAQMSVRIADRPQNRSNIRKPQPTAQQQRSRQAAASAARRRQPATGTNLQVYRKEPYTEQPRRVGRVR